MTKFTRKYKNYCLINAKTAVYGNLSYEDLFVSTYLNLKLLNIAIIALLKLKHMFIICGHLLVIQGGHGNDIYNWWFWSLVAVTVVFS